MESNLNNSLSVEIPNYSGPLEVLLDLAKAQKVDLANISITQLADQFIEFINRTKEINLELIVVYNKKLGDWKKPKIKIIKVEEPPKRKAGIMVNNVKELVEKLKYEAKVI